MSSLGWSFVVAAVLVVGCTSGSDSASTPEPTVGQATVAQPTVEPTVEATSVPVTVVPVAGEPCSYLHQSEVVDVVGRAFDGLTVTDDSCLLSLQTLTSGPFAGEKPTVRVRIAEDESIFEDARIELAAIATPVDGLGDDAFVVEGDGLIGGETYVRSGDVTVVVGIQLVFDEQDDRADAQRALAALVVSRL